MNLALPFVPRMMRAFCALYPELRVAIELDDRPTDFVRDGIDVALRTTPGALKDSSLVSLKLSESPLRLYASPRYLAARGTPRRAADLEAHDCLIRPTRGRARWVLSHGDEQTELQPVGKVAVRSEAVLRDLAIEGLGIALLSESECRAALASGALVPVLRTLTGGSEALYVLHAGGPYVPSKVRAFVDFVRGQLGEVRRTRQLAISE